MNSIKLKDILLVVIVMSFSQLIRCDDKEFCQYFGDNQFKIDFGLYHHYSPDEDDPNRYYLFIGLNYWTLERDDLKVTVGTKTKFDASDWMNNTFRGALHLTVCPKKVCNEAKKGDEIPITAFVSLNPSSVKSSTKELWEVVLKPLNRMSDPELHMTHVQRHLQYNNQKRDFQLDSNTGIAFNFRAKFNIFCILWQYSENQGFKRDYRCFHFDNEANITDNVRYNQTDHLIDGLVKIMLSANIKMKSGNESNPSQVNLLNIRASREVAAILFYPDEDDDERKSSFLFLHSFDKKLVYCWTEGILFNKVCEPNAILIDCSDFKTKPIPDITFTTTSEGTPSEQMLSTTEPIETTEGSTAKSKTKFPIIWLIVIVIVVVLGFATIFGLYSYIQLKKKHYNEQQSVTNQSSISSTVNSSEIGGQKTVKIQSQSQKTDTLKTDPNWDYKKFIKKK